MWTGGRGMLAYQRRKEKRMRLSELLFAAGVFWGFALMYAGRGVLLENTGMLNEQALREMKNSMVYGDSFFWYVLQRRVGLVLLVGLLSTTWLGLAASFCCTAWLGTALGMLLMAAMLRYGIKGILLVLIGMLPQAVVYVPAIVWLLKWSSEFCMTLYYPDRLPGEAGSALQRTGLLKKRVVQYAVLLGVVITGCLLESYVNPKLVSAFLKIF